MSVPRKAILLVVLMALSGVCCFGGATPYVPVKTVANFIPSWTMKPADDGSRFDISDGKTKVTIHLRPSVYMEVLPGKSGPGIAASGSLWKAKSGDQVLKSMDFEGALVESYGPVATVEVVDKKGLGIQGVLSVSLLDQDRLGLDLYLSSAEKRRLQVDFPTLSGMKHKSANLSYCMPGGISVIDNVPINLRQPYCGPMTLRFMDVYGPTGGIYLLAADPSATYRYLHLSKDAKGVALGVEYLDQEVGPGSTFKSIRTTIGFHDGDWHTALDAYRQWLKDAFKPDAGQTPCTDMTAPVAASPSHVDLTRFAFPDARMVATGPATQSFFNGEKIGSEGTADKDITKMQGIIKKYDDCFTSLSPVPLVPTGHKMVFANQFPGQNRILWTLFNASNSTVRGELLAVAHTPGAKYHNVWNGLEIKPRIVKEIAYLNLQLGPRDVGCVVKKSHR